MLYNPVMKKIVALCLLIAFVFSNSSVFAEVLEGHAEKTEHLEQQLQRELFTGEIEHLERRDVINNALSLSFISLFAYLVSISSRI